MHLEDEEIQRVLHGELDEPVRRAWQEHLGQCSSCRRRVEEAGRDEAEIFELLTTLDHPVPELAIERLLGSERPTRAGDWKRKAAVIALVLGGAGVAYAAPGSPLPGWIEAVASTLTHPRQAKPVTPTKAEPPASAPAGIAVAPGRRFTIAFTSDQPSGSATVRLIDGPDIVVRTVNGTAAFLTDVDRLTVSNENSTADYEVDLPRSAPQVEILVAGRRAFLKRGSHVVSEASATDGGRYPLLLHPRVR